MLRGTSGDDVIVTRGAAAVLAKRGSDRICVTGTNRRDGGTDIDAGPGDDRVQVKTSRTGQLDADLGGGDDRMVVTTTPARRILTYLGSGKDVYRGGTGRDFVYADYRNVYHQAPGDAVDRISTGDGADEVQVGLGGTTDDVLDLGAGDDALTVAGLLSPDVRPEGGAGSDLLQIGNATNCRAYPTGPRCTEQRDWVIDNTLEVGTVDGVVQSGWSRFETFDLTDLTLGSATFIGSDADEAVIAPTRLSGATMGPGDDSLRLNSVIEGQQQDFSGGAGRDTIDVRGFQLTVDLPAGELWEQPWPQQEPASAHVYFNDFENASGRGEYQVNLVGDDGDNTLFATSCYVTGTGGAGDDVLATNPDNRFDDCDYYQPGVTFDGGAGADVLRGGWGPDNLDGGDGDDAAYGSRGTDVCIAEVRHACEQ